MTLSHNQRFFFAIRVGTVALNGYYAALTHAPYASLFAFRSYAAAFIWAFFGTDCTPNINLSLNSLFP